MKAVCPKVCPLPQDLSFGSPPTVYGNRSELDKVVYVKTPSLSAGMCSEDGADV